MLKRKKSTANITKIGLLLPIFFPLFYAGASMASDDQSDNKVLPKCLYVSSYHKGYDWSDGVESGLRSVLEGRCQVSQVDMDTKRRKSDYEKKKAAELAFLVIKDWQPDIIITSDDNAAKYLIVPYSEKVDVPFVFNGVNWTVEEYGFPYPNVTGIVEVAPIEPMLSKAVALSNGNSAIYLGADTLTEGKNFQRIKSGADKLGISLEKVLVSSFADWSAAFKQAQMHDFIVMGSNSGIRDWDAEKAETFATDHSSKLSVSNHAWMMNVTALGFTKIPQEHGQWAAEAAMAILEGASPSDIPIATNRKWELWMNNALVAKTGVKVPSNFSRRAKRLASID